jgi:hypothetical protein
MGAAGSRSCVNALFLAGFVLAVALLKMEVVDDFALLQC